MVVRTGNTIPPPPRLSGEPKADTLMQQRWLNTLYDILTQSANVIGTLADHEVRIVKLEKGTGY